ncbi:MAG: acyl-CoA dehydrogenase family protein [Candidatus Dormiibacterota bacterium]
MTEDRFVDIAAELAEKFAESSADHDRTGGVPHENLELARRRGAPALTVATEFGGMGANLLEFARYQERLARGDGATALILAMHHMLIGGEGESGLWTQASFEAVCRAAVQQGALVNAAATEPGRGTPSQGGLPGTTATPAGGVDAADPAPDSQWTINGVKAYTTGAPELGFLRVAARVDPPAGEPYGARFLVQLPSPGVRLVEPEWDPIGLKAAANQDVHFADAPALFLYREDRRGCEGNTWFQVAIAATYLGIGQAAYEAGRDYAHRRQVGAGDRVVTDLESVRVRLGRTRGALMVARRNLFATAAEWAELPPARREELVSAVALAKVAAVNASAAAADESLRLAGAAGLDRRLPLERYVRETRAGLAHPPVDDVAYIALAAEDLDHHP